MKFIKLLNTLILEELSITYGGSPDDVFNPDWFEIRNPKFNMSRGLLNFSLRMVLANYKSKYEVKVIKIEDDGKIVGFLLYSMTNKEKEGIKNNSIPDVEYPVVLSVAIDPDFRGRGLLKKMLQKANIIDEFLVHTSGVSPREIWDRFNCKPIQEVSGGNFVEYCKSPKR
jgi:hypothetical protein